MMNKLLLILAAFSMTGCMGLGTHANTPTKTEYKVVMPESKYFTCDIVKLPDPKNLTDAQIAQLINDLVKANKICHNNMDGIKTYLQAAQDVLEKR
jgi:hypothetical protein